jgi:DNA-binding XRE family transcriptional regulator
MLITYTITDDRLTMHSQGPELFVHQSLLTPHYDAFRAKLVAMREAAGLTQRELAAKLGRERSFVSRIELGERRLDVVEFYWVCRAVWGGAGEAEENGEGQSITE